MDQSAEGEAVAPAGREVLDVNVLREGKGRSFMAAELQGSVLADLFLSPGDLHVGSLPGSRWFWSDTTPGGSALSRWRWTRRNSASASVWASNPLLCSERIINCGTGAD